MKGVAFGGLKSKSAMIPPPQPLLKTPTDEQATGGIVNKGLPFPNKMAGSEVGPSPLEGTDKYMNSKIGGSDIIAADAVDEEDITIDFDNEAEEGDANELSDEDDDGDAASVPNLGRIGNDESSSSGPAPPPKKMGTGASFAPKAFTPPQARPRPTSAEIVDAEIDDKHVNIEGNSSFPAQEEKTNESVRQTKQTGNLWSGESFYGTASSRVYGLGSTRTSAAGGALDNPREKDEATSTNVGKMEENNRVTADNAKAGARQAEMPRTDLEIEALAAEQERREEVIMKKREEEGSRLEDEKRLVEEKARVAFLLADAERKMALQLKRIDEERGQTKAELAKAAREKAEAEKKMLNIEATRLKEVRWLEKRLAEEMSSAKRMLKEEQDHREAERNSARAEEEARWIEKQNLLVQRLAEEKAKVNTEILEATRRMKDEQERREADRAQARAQEEARWIKEQNILVQKRLEERLDEEKANLNAEISEVKRKLKESEMEVKRSQARAEEEARWIEEQNELVQKRLEKRLAEEKMKGAAEISQAKQEQERREAGRVQARAEEEARWLEEQNVLIQERLETRLAEEKAKVNAEISRATQMMREEREQAEAERAQVEEAERLDKLNELVEERLQLRLAELMKEKDGQAVTVQKPSDVAVSTNESLPRRSPKATHDSIDDGTAKAAKSLTPSELSGHVSVGSIKEHVSDTLATDVKALELVSMCQPDFDPKTYPPSRRGKEEETCLLPTEYPFVELLRDSSPYIVNHRHSTIVYHIPGDLISNAERFHSVMDDIALTWLFGMKIVLVVGCRKQILQRLEKIHGRDTSNGFGASSKLGLRVTDPESLRILEEEAGFCRFEVERLLNRCLRNKGADCNVVSGCFLTAKKIGVVDGVDYQHTGYPTALQTDRIHRFHSRNDVVLLTPLGFTKDGDALNIHSEALAAFTAGALEARTKLVYFSSNPMVLRGSIDATNQRIQMIQRSNALQILSHYGLNVHTKTGFPLWRKTNNLDGHLDHDQQAMLLKMGWATHAIDRGVERAHIIDCEDGALLKELFTARRGYGTCISQDGYEAPHPEDKNDDLSVADGASMIER
mmetsp:Transcript_12054/g.26279  ORF Transcript_12054/g.26279 Transcript_12054/m.26279 type:complete len:1083 (-) Transcript_12054:123-3371(-)